MTMMTIVEAANTKIRGEKVITFPLRADTYMIWDAKGNRVMDIRGWGRIQYHQDADRAAEIHDTIAEWVVKTLNEAWEREQKGI